VRIGVAQRYTLLDVYETVLVQSNVGGVTTTIISRLTSLSELNVWNHLDVYSSLSGTDRIITVLINNQEMIVATVPSVSTFTGKLQIDGTVAKYDNIVIATATPALIVGTFDTTVETFDQTFNGDTQLDVIEWYCNTLAWSYKVNYRSGLGSDTFDCGATVGFDLSSLLTVQEGFRGCGNENSAIVDLSKDRISQDLSTILRVYGQSQDDATSNFVSMFLSGFLQYGIIEGDYSDPRVTSAAIAKALGDARLLVTGVGNVSLSGTILDESMLLGQAGVWDAGVWDGTIWDSINRFNAGDSFWLKSRTLDIDRAVQIVSIKRQSGNRDIELTLDYFRWQFDDAYRQLMRLAERLVRAQSLRDQAETWDFDMVGTPPDPTRRYYLIRGQVPSVLIDVTGQGGSATANITKFDIDGTDRIATLFGGSIVISQGSHVSAIDTQYLVTENNHYLEITCDGSCFFRIKVTPQCLA
jgi:hypothetical protein